MLHKLLNKKTKIKSIPVFYTTLIITFNCYFYSCSPHQAEKKYKIGFSQCTGGDNWRVKMLEGMERELSFHPGTIFLYKDAHDNSELQIKQIKELVDQKIDILLVSPNEAYPLTPIVEEVFTKGIPVIIIDRKTTSELYTSFVGANNYEIGKMAGNYISNLLKGKGNIIEVIGLPGSTPALERQKGFADGVKDYPSIKVISQLYGNWLKERAKEEISKNIENLSKADIVFAHNDMMALGAYEAYVKSGLQNKVKFIGVDGLPGPEGGIQLVSDKILNATLLYPTGGEESIQTAFKILNKKSFDKENILQTVVIDSTNVRLMKLQTDKIGSQQKDIQRQQSMISEQVRIYNNQKTLVYILIGALILVIIMGSILFYALQNNRKINQSLIAKNRKIINQRNQLIKMTAKAQEATDAKFNFFTNISHEFRTPLTLILGPLEEVLSSPKLHFTNKGHLELVQKNVIRLLRLVNQLMDFRKIEHGKMKLNASENDLIAFVRDVANSFHGIAQKKGIIFNIDTKEKFLPVWFDVNMLDKVLFNLLSNAFKFTGEYGTILISISKSIDNRYAIINVKDSGIGMSTETAKHAFDLFFQGQNSISKGSGLGLNLSRELISLHHGSITVKSETNNGSNFEICLPLGDGHLSKEEKIIDKENNPNITYEDLKIYTTELEKVELSGSENESDLKEYSLLIIEDNEDLQNFLRTRLKDQFEIYGAENGNKGLALAYEIVPDLILCDIILPGKDGMDIVNMLKNDVRTSHIPIILLTAKGGVEEQIKGMKYMADAFIVKPFNLHFLKETIKCLLKNREMIRDHYTSELPVETRPNSPKKIDRKFVNEFVSIVESNIANENFGVDDICKGIGISRVQLYRKIKALLGYNVNDYILSVRLQKAKYLLLNKDLSIAEIACKVGFSSQAYFSTVFKSKFSITPSEYKDQVKNEIKNKRYIPNQIKISGQ